MDTYLSICTEFAQAQCANAGNDCGGGVGLKSIATMVAADGSTTTTCGTMSDTMSILLGAVRDI